MSIKSPLGSNSAHFAQRRHRIIQERRDCCESAYGQYTNFIQSRL